MAITRKQTATNTRENLGDAGITWYSVDDINQSIQDGYNLLSALLAPIQHTTFFPLRASPYYHFTDFIGDLYAIQGIYNPFTNLWLDYHSMTELNAERWDWERWNGQAAFWTPKSFRTTCVVPWNPQPSGAIYLAYIAKAEELTDNSVPLIPSSCSALLEYYSTCDLLEQAREFKKAQTYLEKFKTGLADSKAVVKDLARIHRLKVMEPWNTLGRYSGSGYKMTLINDETPVGAIDGVNATYVISQAPNPTSSLSLFKNGQLLKQGVAYTYTGTIININTPYILQPDDILSAWYQIS